MGMSKVVVLRCEGYEYSAVRSAVEKGIDILGGPSSFVKAGEKILLKPNWLAGDPPEKCTTTHPIIFKAVSGVFQKTGADLSYGDAPSFQSPIIVAQKTGFLKVADELGIPLADFWGGRDAFIKTGMQNKKFFIANGVLDSDGVISLPKLKTHGFQRFTGCIKNQFGCIPGPGKAEFHVKLPDASDFAKMLVDLNSLIKPRLYIMDGIIAMEGNGPRGGAAKKLNVLLFSSDPVALDATACRIIDCAPELVPTNIFGRIAGQGTYAANEIELLGDPLEGFIDRGFDVKREPAGPRPIRKILRPLKTVLVPKPYILQKKCIKCGVCVKVCPVYPKALHWRGDNRINPPSYNYKKCIRCFCCQELCPESAIRIRVPIIRKVIFKVFQYAAQGKTGWGKK
jgi:uncharacterized protein (DUF362 family)/Pyruvate/2-oxoacid:ferredoxin oxidoreductase delta subunit